MRMHKRLGNLIVRQLQSVVEQIEYLIDNPIRTRARTVNFIDNNGGRRPRANAF